jgi:hypothetical protein
MKNPPAKELCVICGDSFAVFAAFAVKMNPLCKSQLEAMYVNFFALSRFRG